MNHNHFSNKGFLDIKKDLAYSGVPLISSVGAILLKVSSPGVIHILVLLLFVGALLLVIRLIRTDWKDSKLAALTISVGFLVWYAIPAINNLFSLGNPFREILPIPIDQETTILAVVYLSLFLITWVLASHLFSRLRFFRPVFSCSLHQTNALWLVGVGIGCCIAGFVPYVASGLGISEVISLIIQGPAPADAGPQA